MSMRVQKLLDEIDASQKEWSRSWVGHQQCDNPTARMHDEKAFQIFECMTEEERASVDEDIRREFEQEEMLRKNET